MIQPLYTLARLTLVAEDERGTHGSGGTGQDHMTKETDDVARATEKIETALRVEKERISQEIRAYPSPIPACDAQFNCLLENATS
jgi:hypothetical protein